MKKPWGVRMFESFLIVVPLPPVTIQHFKKHSTFYHLIINCSNFYSSDQLKTLVKKQKLWMLIIFMFCLVSLINPKKVAFSSKILLEIE